MKIRGVFSMSIINRLKSLFKGDNEESDINSDVSNTSDDVKVTSSKTVSVTVSKGDEEVTLTKEKVTTESGESKTDLTIEKNIKPEKEAEVASEEIVKEVETEEAEAEEVSEDVEEVKEDSNNNNKERDKMTLLTDKELLNDSNRDPDFTAEFIDAGIETVKHCFQCGTCSGSCPSGRRTPYKVRQIVRKCLLGLKEEVISDDALWMCTTCYTCQERCLRSVKIVEIIKKARNIAAHAIPVTQYLLTMLLKL